MNLAQKALATDNGINYTNMALMLVSTILAFAFPFHLFLFVYAVLGPLHYLTEISWLEKKNFFLAKKSDILLYIFMSILLTIPVFNSNSSLANFGINFLITAVIFTIILFTVKNTFLKYFAAFTAFFVSYYFHLESASVSIMWFGILLPTIIHVFVFTALFILFGALKAKSKTGILSFFFLLTCTLSFFIFTPTGNGASAGPFIEKNLSNFDLINKGLIYLFGLDPSVKSVFEAIRYPSSALFSSPAAVTVARFIAFVYTYHYLNWFSKTAVIKWHDVPKGRMLFISVLWLLSIASYLLNYNFGFKVLFLFSMLHVLLEFPLNFVTIRGIGQQLFSRKP